MQLMAHQIEMVERIKKQGSLVIGSEPGTGKTAGMIEATKGYNKILILTLASLKYQMREELLKWLPNAKVVVIEGSPTERIHQWHMGAMDKQYFIANYELLLRDLAWMKSINWDYIVCDEATRLSNVRNKQYKALRQLKSRFRLPMTGTPISNSPTDCFGIFDWAVPNSLGHYWGFMTRYCIKNNQGWAVGYRNLDELALRIKPFMLRRTKEEVLDLPDKIYTNIPFPLSDKERKLYEQLKKGLLLEIEKKEINKVEHISSLDSTIVKFGKLCELCDSMELLGEGTLSSKLDVLRDLLTTLNGSKVIIFTRFSRFARIIQRELKCLMIIGDIPAEERNNIISTFNKVEGSVLVGTKAMAYGLNLQTASVIINLDPPLSIAEYEQRIARSDRYGQTKNVLIYNIVVMKSVEERMYAKLEKKQDMSRLLLADIVELID